MQLKFNIIAAVCEGNGIGINGQLPWKLKGEMAYFKKITSTPPSGAEGKKNVVIMGRKTWESIPSKFRPLDNRINVVISTTMESGEGSDASKGVMVFRSLGSALSALALPPYSDLCADFWLIGGSSLYAEALRHPNCHRLYITHVLKKFDCDTFLPAIPAQFKAIKVDGVPEGKQEENGIEYEYKVYEATSDPPA
ncbi:dihydrofolate reductase [Nesidiocoris tenuis]|uniref:dihydrofolate reductase n=1 Tax=Nesidiocoris tenuis TaxID=355587 RepID=A0ABN7B0H4_9HEMI|nr:dihydrofolate reductase [Nesidiocoris tenuis]